VTWRVVARWGSAAGVESRQQDAGLGGATGRGTDCQHGSARRGPAVW
jgi:hypothetical protein